MGQSADAQVFCEVPEIGAVGRGVRLACTVLPGFGDAVAVFL